MGTLVVPREYLLLTLNPASKGLGGKGNKLAFEQKLGFVVT